MPNKDQNYSGHNIALTGNKIITDLHISIQSSQLCHFYNVLKLGVEFVSELPPYTEGEAPPASSGDWLLWTHTGDEEDASPNADVAIIVIGAKGESQPIPLKTGKAQETKEEPSKKGQDKKNQDKKSRDKKANDKQEAEKKGDKTGQAGDTDDKLKPGATDEYKVICQLISHLLSYMY